MQPDEPDRADRLETPERVDLAVDYAGVGSRAAAYLLDMLIVTGAWIVGAVVTSFAVRIAGAWALAALVLFWFALTWLYFAVLEASWDGQTPGKRALGLRVQRVGGYPIGWTEALLRNFARIADLMPVYAAGVVAMLATRRHQRIGDLVAGTVVVRERRAGIDALAEIGYAPPERVAPSGGWSPELTPDEYELIHDFLRRRPRLDPATAARVEARVAASLRGRLDARGVLPPEWSSLDDERLLLFLDAAYRGEPVPVGAAADAGAP